MQKMKTRMAGAMVLAGGLVLLGAAGPAFAITEADCQLAKGEWTSVPGWGEGCIMQHKLSAGQVENPRIPPPYFVKATVQAHPLTIENTAAPKLPIKASPANLNPGK